MARDFSGSGQYLTIDSGLGLTANESFWISAWVWVDTLAAAHGIVGSGVSGTATNRRFLAVQVTNGLVQASATATAITSTASSPTGLTANTWYNIVGEWGSSTSRAASHSGGTRGTSSDSTFLLAAPDRTRIAAYQAGTVANPLNGRIAYPAIWRGVPTDSDRSALASGLHPMFVQPTNLIECLDITGATSPEPGRFGNAFTLTGSPTQIEGPRIVFPRMRSMVALPVAPPAAPGGAAHSFFMCVA